MDGFIDIYSKLLISILSFIAPIIVYLLSVFSDGIALVRRKTIEENEQTTKLLRERINDSNFDTKLVEESNEQLQENKKRNDKMVRLLTPKRQIYRIFTPLFTSLFLIMVDKFIREEPSFYNHWLSVCLIISSLVAFILGLLIIKQVAWGVIDTKEQIAEELAKTKSSPPVQTINIYNNGTGNATNIEQASSKD